MRIFQLGLGAVGQAVIHQLLSQHQALHTRYGIALDYCGLADSRNVLASSVLDASQVQQALAAKQAGRFSEQAGSTASADWLSLLPNQPCVVVDVTAAGGLEPSLAQAVTAGHCVVLANKRPLTADWSLFGTLTAGGATRYEATVGAGLPIIDTLQRLLDSGDELVSIEASMSGTLGYLCSALEQGEPLAAAVRTAHANGWTEPDPRDDLSGADVARKALILARTCGLPWSMDDVPSEPWFPADFADLSNDAFLERLTELDASFAERVAEAQARNAVLRYVATITPQGAAVGLHAIARDHPLAALRGPDNLFSITTLRYRDNPLVVRGPGAGVDVTAASVVGDIVATARALAA